MQIVIRFGPLELDVPTIDSSKLTGEGMTTQGTAAPVEHRLISHGAGASCQPTRQRGEAVPSIPRSGRKKNLLAVRGDRIPCG